MARRGDYRKHDVKKPKKGEKRPTITSVLPPALPVEVLKTKGKKEREEA